MNPSDPWPPLPLADWQATYDTIHMWSQIVGKVRMALAPMTNHWWQVVMYVTARGLSTSPIPYADQTFEIQFDFLSHTLIIELLDGRKANLPLRPQSVADFYSAFTRELKSLGIEVEIWPVPVEFPDAIAFAEDKRHASYDAEAVGRFFRVLSSVDRVLKEFRGRFIGKCSPVQFFWGSFDHAVTRFSGRTAPERPGADAVTREAYSHEVISHGFWPGGSGVDSAAFYAYAAPEPAGFRDASIKPEKAVYHPELKEFILKYDDVRSAGSPEQAILDFCQSTYEAGADLGNWNRKELEWHL